MSPDLEFVIPAWMDDAACQTTNPDWFFKEDTASVKATKGICKPCKVRTRCLAHALEHDEVGVWGGTTYAERRALRGDA